MIFERTDTVNHGIVKIKNLRKLRLSAKAQQSFADKDYKQSLAYYDSLKNFGRTSYEFMKIGMNYYHLNDYAEALKNYKQAAEIDSGIATGDYYDKTGKAFLRAGMYAEAEKAFTKCDIFFPEAGWNFYNWTVFYALQNKKQKAITHLQKALELGSYSVGFIMDNEDFKNIMDEPEFKAIMKIYE